MSSNKCKFPKLVYAATLNRWFKLFKYMIERLYLKNLFGINSNFKNYEYTSGPSKS